MTLPYTRHKKTLLIICEIIIRYARSYINYLLKYRYEIKTRTNFKKNQKKEEIKIISNYVMRRLYICFDYHLTWCIQNIVFVWNVLIWPKTDKNQQPWLVDTTQKLYWCSLRERSTGKFLMSIFNGNHNDERNLFDMPQGRQDTNKSQQLLQQNH